MSEKRKYLLACVLMNVGILVAVGWGLVSILGLVGVVAYSAKWYEVVRALGPAGIAVMVLGGTLCRWDLRGMKERIQADS